MLLTQFAPMFDVNGKNNGLISEGAFGNLLDTYGGALCEST